MRERGAARPGVRCGPARPAEEDGGAQGGRLPVAGTGEGDEEDGQQEGFCFHGLENEDGSG